MAGLYTIFDCLTEGRPFAPRVLHEVVHHWAQAAHELASFSMELDRFGLCFMRRGGLEQSIPFGKHARQAVHSDLDNLQVCWINDCDLSRENQKACPDPLQPALEALARLDNVKGLAVQVWTFRANHILSSLSVSALTEKLLSAGVDITVVKLADARSELAEVHGVKVISMACTKSAVRRFLRQRLAVQIAMDLELPTSLETATEWKMESFQMDSNPSRTFSCNGVPVTLLLPGQQEAATARLSVCAFQFRCFVRLGGIDPCCFYGLPLVLRPAQSSNLAARLGREDGHLKFLEHLSQGVGALYVSKVCPMELSSKSRSTFTWLATVPVGASSEPVLLLRGLCDMHRAVLPSEVVLPDDGNQGSTAPPLERTWPKLGFYNPWPMVQGVMRLEDTWLPSTVEAKTRGAGRPGARAKGRPRAESREAPELRHKLRAEPASSKPAQPAPGPEPATPPEAPVAPSARKTATKAAGEGTLASLASMLKQPPRRRLRPAGSGSEITEEEVRRLADGNFQFNF